MIRDLDRVVLTAPVLAHDLKVGDVGTVVHVYGDGEALEVEFVSGTVGPRPSRLWRRRWSRKSRLGNDDAQQWR